MSNVGGSNYIVIVGEYALNIIRLFDLNSYF